ncbi:MAG: site-specific integrase [Conexivisphaera sp.]
MRSKYAHLLSDPRVRGWIENARNGSECTADRYIEAFGRFLSLARMAPGDLIDLARRDPVALRDRVAAVLHEMAAEGRLPATLQFRKAVVASFLRYNGIEVPLKVKIRGAGQHPLAESERVPTQEELARAMRAANPRARAAMALMAYTGLRPEVLGDYRGTDGLVLGDLPDLVIEGGHARFTRIPAAIVVRAGLSKAKHRYTTFLPEEGARIVEEYLEIRARSGEALAQKSPVIRGADGGFLTRRRLSGLIRSSLRAAGLKVRPYALRAYFATALDVAEARGIVSHSWRQFWMGHKGDIEAEYSTRKSIPPDVLEQMRAAFAKFSRILVAGFMPPREDAEAVVLRNLLRLAGYSEEEVASVDLSNVGADDIRAMIERKMREAAAARRQVVVGPDEAERYISEGYEFVATLPNGRVILRPPAPAPVDLISGAAGPNALRARA